MAKRLIFMLLMMFPTCMFSQILNLDRTIEGDSATMSKKLKFAALIGGSVYSFQQTSSFDNESFNYDLTYYMPKGHILILSGKYNVTNSEGNVLQNLGYIHLRYRDNDNKKLSAEPFAQYQWNNTIGLIHRDLFGCNARVKIFENSKMDIYYGLGVMHENEEWDFNGVTDTGITNNWDHYKDSVVKTDLVKSNTYLKASFSIGTFCDLATAVFLQSNVNDFSKTYRLSNYTTLYFRISKKFTFSVSEDISYDNNPVVPIKKTLYTMMYGLTIKL